MEKEKIKSGNLCRMQDKEFVLLRYKIDDTQGWQFKISGEKIDTELELLISKDTKLISKASLTIKGVDKNGQKIDGEYEQLFINYNNKFNTEKPQEVLNLGASQKSN